MSDLPLLRSITPAPSLVEASAERVEAVLQDAIVRGSAGYLPRSSDLLLATLCARFLRERMEAAGMVVVTLRLADD